MAATLKLADAPDVICDQEAMMSHVSTGRVASGTGRDYRSDDATREVSQIRVPTRPDISRPDDIDRSLASVSDHEVEQDLRSACMIDPGSSSVQTDERRAVTIEGSMLDGVVSANAASPDQADAQFATLGPPEPPKLLSPVQFAKIENTTYKNVVYLNIDLSKHYGEGRYSKKTQSHDPDQIGLIFTERNKNVILLDLPEAAAKGRTYIGIPKDVDETVTNDRKNIRDIFENEYKTKVSPAGEGVMQVGGMAVDSNEFDVESTFSKSCKSGGRYKNRFQVYSDSSHEGTLMCRIIADSNHKAVGTSPNGHESIQQNSEILAQQLITLQSEIKSKLNISSIIRNHISGSGADALNFIKASIAVEKREYERGICTLEPTEHIAMACFMIDNVKSTGHLIKDYGGPGDFNCASIKQVQVLKNGSVEVFYNKNKESAPPIDLEPSSSQNRRL